ncbi:defensin-like protein 2 [Brassica rapa]|uniref:defensin-like protein 2 n=1 Tax=Brassica napus TaxID=3708 RepID=UPI00142DA7A8|nr:defensin-like protein 2 [Brassica napus]XP_033142841.1 defensin-like protein 2 [Brassica rapa]
MAMTTKSVSSLAIFFILCLVIFEVPETEAQDRKCLKEYGGDVGFSFCAPRIYPSFCYQRCRQNKGAKGGKCRSEAGTGMKCLCDFCSNTP